jgi:BirA family transcriptional regulator, biotin operon repressor / biotin---[acetyl-CoA-carboxylase] ligase
MDVATFHFETIDSTNTWAKQNAHLFDKKQITLITADEQTAGRGRFKRTWVSPAQQNIYATFCFFVDPKRKDLGNIPQVLALSAAEMLESYDFNPALRWPNDILLEGKKVAGILCETTMQESLCFIAGIGINVNMSLTYLEEIDRPATSMQLEQGRPFNHLEVLRRLEKTFVRDLTLFLSEGFAPFLALYREKMVMAPNKILSFHDNLTIWEGYFDSINEDGSLNLRLPDGEIKRFIAGEFIISH